MLKLMFMSTCQIFMKTLFAGTGYPVIIEIVLMLTLIAWILFGSRLKCVKKSYTFVRRPGMNRALFG